MFSLLLLERGIDFMKRVSILSELKTQQPPLLQEYGRFVRDIEAPVTCKKIGHIYSVYDGCRWHDSIQLHDLNLITQLAFQEFKKVCERLTADDAFRNAAALREFCRQHPEAEADHCRGEYNFFYEGECCTYWLHCVPRKGKCAFYLHTFVKEAPHG